MNLFRYARVLRVATKKEAADGHEALPVLCRGDPCRSDALPLLPQPADVVRGRALASQPPRGAYSGRMRGGRPRARRAGDGRAGCVRAGDADRARAHSRAAGLRRAGTGHSEGSGWRVASRAVAAPRSGPRRALQWADEWIVRAAERAAILTRLQSG